MALVEAANQGNLPSRPQGSACHPNQSEAFHKIFQCLGKWVVEGSRQFLSRQWTWEDTILDNALYDSQIRISGSNLSVIL